MFFVSHITNVTFISHYATPFSATVDPNKLKLRLVWKNTKTILIQTKFVASTKETDLKRFYQKLYKKT